MTSVNFGFLRKYKREIVSAVVGATLTGVLSLVVGLYSVSKSFELTQNKETLSSLRRDIVFLNKLEREFDRNLELMSVQNYTMEIDVKKVPSPLQRILSKPPTTKEEKESFEVMKAIAADMDSVTYTVTKTRGPSEPFRMETWLNERTNVTEVDFQLLQDLDEFYRELIKINRVIAGLQRLGKGSQINEPYMELINRDLKMANLSIKEVTKQKILGLKNRVRNEVQRLHDQRSRILN